MSNVSTGGRFEERIARLLCASRQEKLHYGHATHDVESDWMIGECKLRKALALETWMQQVEGYKKEGKVCLVFSKGKGLRDNKTIVSMRLDDFINMRREAGYMICKHMEEGICQDKEHDCPEGCCMYCELKDEPCPYEKCKEIRDDRTRWPEKR